MTNSTGQLVQIAIPGGGEPILATLIDGEPFAALRPMCEAIGIDYARQFTKLKAKSWATVVMRPTVAADGKQRDMTMIDRRTMTMWLATIDENRVAETARPLVRAYQAEAADALDAYFHKGGAINPRADEHQRAALIREAQMQMELCQAAKGLIHPDHLEARARVVLSRGLSENAELDPMRKPLYTQDFLKGKKLSTARMKSVAGMFGKRVKSAYIAEHGREPQMYPLNLSNGQTKEVRAYTEADRPLMERVWNEHYAPLTLDMEAKA